MNYLAVIMQTAYSLSDTGKLYSFAYFSICSSIITTSRGIVDCKPF
ncbi:hypothetical protein QNI19_30280 [Cytophagaceae bacterium DM2B3-1]|uniref:Uncharacterized protein n=1 Tax=Xanthocytophaga flava TaxID=3048013 RepID=A0ABT7CU12_9BACT|nr:hypothetical protein [Xanthocytophaga flavus]MDJ1472512.1 hypothetical protein [Xanthocytophaga flavus]MDJ1497265.1 hypothetical protein [Xanthocytophaga flavus]